MADSLLDEIIHRTGISKTQFAKDLKVSKSFVLRICKGEKTISDKLYEDILRLPYISEGDRARLAKERLINKIGKQEFERVEIFLKRFSELGTFLDAHSEVRANEAIFAENKSGVFLTGTVQVLETAVALIQRALKAHDPFIYTNFPASFHTLAEAVFAALYNRDYSIPLDFGYLLQPATPYDEDALDSFSVAFKFVLARLSTYICPTSGNVAPAPLPYFMLTNAGVLLFGQDRTNGIVLLDPEMIAFYKARVSSIKKSFQPITYIIKDEVDMLSNAGNTEMTDMIYTIDGGIGPVTGFYSDAEVLYKVSQDIPMLDYLIHGYLNHYNRQYYRGCISFMNQNALDYFLQTGYIWNCRTKYVGHCEPEYIMRFLTNYKDSFSQNEDFKIKLIEANHFNLPPNFSINVHHAFLRVNYYFDDGKDDNYLGMLCIPFTPSNGLETLFLNLKHYLLQSDIVFDDTRTVQAIEHAILKCKFRE